MWIERKVEGERPARMKLDAQPMNARKFRLKLDQAFAMAARGAVDGELPSSATSRRSGNCSSLLPSLNAGFLGDILDICSMPPSST
jgi:hypothetical protein